MNKLTLVVLLFLSCSVFSQRAADETLDFDGNVTDLIIVPFNGIVVISDGKNLNAYNPDTDESLWVTPIPKVSGASALLNADLSVESIFSTNRKGSGFDVIPDTPFLQKFFDNRLYIINSFDGNVIFASDGSDVFFFQSEYLFEENALLLRGMKDKSLVIAKYDLKNEAYQWETEVSENFGTVFSKLSAAAGKDQTGATDKLELIEDKIFLLAKSKFYVLDNESGNLLWSAEENDYAGFNANQDATYVLLNESKGFFAGKSLLYLKNAKDGSSVWEDPIKTKRLVLFEDWKDKMLLAHYKGFNFYDFETGEKVWEKDPKGKNIKSVIPEGTDFLYVYDNEMMLIDKDGQKKWRRDVKICDDDEDPVFFLEKTKNGKILYVTATYANMVDYSTGEKIWSGNLKLNEKRLTVAKFDENTGDFVIYNDEKLYRFNENSTERPKPYAKLKLKDEKLITSMEIFPNNVSISGQSEVIGVKEDGEVLFHNKYKQPGEFGRRFLKGTMSVVKTAGAIATTNIEISQVTRDENGNEQVTKVGEIGFDEKTRQIGNAGYIAGNIGSQFVKDRYNALQETDVYAIIFAKGENGEKLLIRVDKETGEELDKITVDTNKPVYDYDPVTKDLFYSSGKEVKIFKGK